MGGLLWFSECDKAVGLDWPSSIGIGTGVEAIDLIGSRSAATPEISGIQNKPTCVDATKLSIGVN